MKARPLRWAAAGLLLLLLRLIEEYMAAAQAPVPSSGPLPMQERVQLCKLLAWEVSSWRPFSA